MRIAVLLQHDACFDTTCYTFIQGIKNGRHGVTEPILPIEGAALGGGGTVGVHPVHAILTDEANEGLSQFLYRFVERFGGRMSMLAEDVVLRLHHTCQCTHQHTALTSKIRVDFILKSGWK